LGQDWTAVQDSIRTYLGTDISLLSDVNDNLLEHFGKQLRPMMMLVIARACGGGCCNEDSIKLATASELLHNATLLHDDVADESDQRRGYPTVRSLMGPNVSVLIGDFWLVRAVRAILDAKNCSHRAIEMFAKTLSDLAEGEMFQLQKASTCDTTFKDYIAIIYRKTASLFVASARAAAMSVSASDQVENSMGEFAEYMGYAFQMKDDIFDYLPDSPSLGKPVGIDVLEQKITLPLLCALDKVSASEQRRIRKMVQEITPERRDEIIDFVRNNGGIEGAQQILEEYCSKALKCLDILPESREKHILQDFPAYFAKRGQ